MRVMSRAMCAALALTGLVGVASPAGASDTAPSRVEVVGGHRAGEGQFPWMVRLSVGCGGALVAPRMVLTAAHCVDRGGWETGIVATAGSADLDGDRAVRVRSEYVLRPQDFRRASGGGDWAVIRLQRALDLPTLRLPRDDRYDRGPFTVMGWGATWEGSLHQQRYLRTAEVPLVDDATCARVYRSQGVEIVPREMVCAGKLWRGGVDTCQGDSGGPMVRRDAKGEWVQVGIVSFGYGCARPGYPGVYTQVSTYTEDITDAVWRLSL